MKIKISILFLSIISLAALADGPVIQVSPFMKPVLESQSSSDAQTKLGFTGTTTLAVISNTAIAAAAPANFNMSNSITGVGFATLSESNIEFFGAVHNGVVLNGVVCNAGNGQVTCSTANWQSSDVGKFIVIEGVGTVYSNVYSPVYISSNGKLSGLTTTNWMTTNEISFMSMITAVANSHTITVSNASGILKSSLGTNAMYGTDDTPAIQAAEKWQAIEASAGISTRIVCPPGIYCLAGPLQNATGGWFTNNYAQLFYPPITNVNSGTVSPSTEIVGTVTPTEAFYSGQGAGGNWNNVGCIFWSMLPRYDGGTNIGAVQDYRNFINPTGGRGCAGDGTYSFTVLPNMQPSRFICQNIIWRDCFDNNMALVDVNGGDTCEFDNCFLESAGSYQSPQRLETGTNNFGLIMPNSWADNECLLKNCEIRGFYHGVNFGHYVTAFDSVVYDCWQAVTFFGGGDHQNSLVHFSIQDCKYYLTPGQCYQSVSGDLTSEGSASDGTGGPAWWGWPVLINDYENAGNLCGMIYYESPGADWGGPLANIGFATNTVQIIWKNMSQVAQQSLPHYLTPVHAPDFVVAQDQTFTNTTAWSGGGQWHMTQPGGGFSEALCFAYAPYVEGPLVDYAFWLSTNNVNGIAWFSAPLFGGNPETSLPLNVPMGITGSNVVVSASANDAFVSIGNTGQTGSAIWELDTTSGGSGFGQGSLSFILNPAIAFGSQKFIFDTNGNVTAAGSISTGSAVFGTGFGANGFTNTTGLNLRIYGLESNSGIVISNRNTGFKASIGSQSSGVPEIILQPGEVIYGTGLSEITNQAF